MSAGNQPSKQDFDSRLGSLSLQTLQLMTQWQLLKEKIDSLFDGQLTNMGYTSALPDPIDAPQLAAGAAGANSLLPSTQYFVAYAWGISTGGTPAVTRPSNNGTFTTASSPSPEVVTIPPAPGGATALYVYVGTAPANMALLVEVPAPNTGGSNVITISSAAPAGAKTPATSNTTGDIQNIRTLMQDVGSFLAFFTGQAALSSPHDFTATVKPFAGMGY